MTMTTQQRIERKATKHILAVTNDVNEGDTKHLKKSELIAAVRYWSLRSAELASEKEVMKTNVLLFAMDFAGEAPSTGEKPE